MNYVDELLSQHSWGRKSASDPFFAAGDIACNVLKTEGVFDIDEEELCHPVVASFPCHIPGCVLTFDSVFEFDQHYNAVHRYFCSECKKCLPSPHLLDLHLSETHDSFFLAQAERKPMYCCYIEECAIKFADPKERREHCIAHHKFPPSFRFDVASRKQTNKQASYKQSNKKKQSNSKPSNSKPSNNDASAMDVAGTDALLGRTEGSESSSSAPAVRLKGFSFGRGGRRGGGHWYQASRQPGLSQSTALTSLADDLRTTLPDESEPMVG